MILKDFGGWSKDEYHKNEKQAISDSMFVIPLIKAIQELTDQNKELSSKVDEMKTEIDELKKK